MQKADEGWSSVTDSVPVFCAAAFVTKKKIIVRK